jgi:hypothetical protein
MAKKHLVLIVLLLLTVVTVSVKQNLRDAPPTNRTNYHAVPVALSAMYFHWPHDYTANGELAEAFHRAFESSNLDQAISETRKATFSPSADPYYWRADDRGFGDYVLMAFRIFGAKTKSLHSFYFLILIAGLATFLITYRRDRTPALIAALYLAAFLLALPLWRHTNLVDRNAINISESRMFSILAVVPFLHLAWFAFRPSSQRIAGGELAAIALQSTIIGFLIHCRSSLNLEVVILSSVLAVAVVQFRNRQRSLRRFALAAALPLVVAFAVVPGYQRLTYNDYYFADGGGRTFWHNVMIGFAHDDYFKSLFALDGSDTAATRAVLRDVKKREPTLDVEAETAQAMNSLSSATAYDWRQYERNARALVFETARTHPVAFARMLFIEKPALVLSYFGYMFDPPWFLKKYGHPWSGDRMTLKFLGYAIIAVLLIVVVFRPTANDLTSMRPLLWLAVAMGAGLFAVPVIFYPMITTIAGSWLYFSLAVFGIVALAAGEALHRWQRRRQAAAH